jgi:hypothetical protein
MCCRCFYYMFSVGFLFVEWLLSIEMLVLGAGTEENVDVFLRHVGSVGIDVLLCLLVESETYLREAIGG